jgi:hypothetical protein
MSRTFPSVSGTGSLALRRLTMASNENPSATLTDLDYAIELIMKGKKDPMFAARVQAETENITEEIERKHGVLNIAVDLIRQARDEV